MAAQVRAPRICRVTRGALRGRTKPLHVHTDQRARRTIMTRVRCASGNFFDIEGKHGRLAFEILATHANRIDGRPQRSQRCKETVEPLRRRVRGHIAPATISDLQIALRLQRFGTVELVDLLSVSDSSAEDSVEARKRSGHVCSPRVRIEQADHRVRPASEGNV